MNENILWLHELRLADLARVGGKNSSLGEMIGHLANLAHKHLPHTAQTERISDTCRATLAALLPQGKTSIDEVAMQLGLQRRTLQRRLETEGVSYSQVLQALREDLLSESRTHRQHSLATVAQQLGFSSASAFSRWHRATYGRAARSA